MITDLWLEPGSWLGRLAHGRLGRRMRDRYSSDLPRDRVASATGRTLVSEVALAARGMRGHALTGARTSRWCGLAARALQREIRSTTRFVFSYCYEAAAPFEEARRLGLAPILGQIDPGPGEDRKVAEVVRRWPSYQTPFQPGSPAYYASWRRECDSAEWVVVNSEWSRQALVAEGINPAKLAVIPLVYDAPPEALSWIRTWPETFSPERPLQALFLGQCILRKGIAELIAAAQSLSDYPIEFTFVGNTDISGFTRHFGRARIRHFPRISRAECHAFYRAADLFLFPTHSDGFGLTQLEAQAWKLPIIASKYCAEVVKADETGLVLEQVTAGHIREVLLNLLGRPQALATMSKSIRPWSFNLDQLGRRLTQFPMATQPASFSTVPSGIRDN